MSSTDYTDLIAIDYGTSNSTAWFKNKKTNLVQKVVYGGGSCLCPSVVQYHANGDVVCVGEGAEKKIGRGTVQGIVRSSKRIIGRPYSDEVVLRSLESCCSPIVNRNGRPVFEVFKNVYKSPTEVASDIIKYIVQSAETVQQSKFTRCSITAPVYFANAQRIEISKAAEAAGLSVVCITDEPCAAAFAYTFSHSQRFSGNLFVYDLGGGTFDSTVVECKSNSFDPVSSGGDDVLGGDDFDRLIFSAVETAYIEEFNCESIYAGDKKGTIKKNALMRTCRIAKEAIGNGAREFAIEVEGAKEFVFTLTSSLMNTILKSKITETQSITMKTMENKCFTTSSINGVVMVGGSTRLSAVTQMLHSLFGKGKIVDSESFDPMTVVSRGAFLKGMAMIASGRIESVRIKDKGEKGGESQVIQVKPSNGVVSVIDRLTVSLGVDCRDTTTNKLILSIITQKGSILPISHSKRYYTSFLATSASICLLQGENVDEPYENKNLGELLIENIPMGGVPLDITFEMSTSGIVYLTVVFEYQNEKRVIIEKERFDTSESAIVGGRGKIVFNFTKPVRCYQQ